MTKESLSPSQARRIALGAQGFTSRRPATTGIRRLAAGVDHLGAIQIDSVNVLARAHYLPLFSRFGPYRREDLDRLTSRTPLRVFEYWGHEASLLPVRLQPHLRWRMARDHAWSGVARTAAQHPARVAEVRDLIAEQGPLTGRQIEANLAAAESRTRDGWGWNWSVTKHLVEHLFWIGEVTAVGRDAAFQRRYDLTERALPRSIVGAPTPDRATAIRTLVAQAARSMGVATMKDLQDYYRLALGDTRTAVAELAESGELVPVTVAGWPAAWLHRDTTVPRSKPGSALLVPFDPLIWNRDRVQRIFGMRYRIEIYVPADQRRHGYYVLPLLLDGELVARVDLKADRAAGRLIVKASWLEPRRNPGWVAAVSAERLVEMSAWLGLGDLEVRDQGDLAAALTSAVAATQR